MKVNILLCDTFPGLLPDYIPSYVDMLTTMFNSVANDVEYRVYQTLEGELPDIASSEGIYLIPGCNMSVYDDVDWIKRLLQWIRQAYQAKVKMAGICFGHQAIAYALGGAVTQAAQGWGVGIRESEILDDTSRSLFPYGKLRLCYNHHDQVTVLPQGARLLATSAFCPIESFSMGNHVLTFQGHPEYTPEYEIYLIENFSAHEPMSVRRSALWSLRHTPQYGKTVAEWFLSWAGVS